MSSESTGPGAPARDLLAGTPYATEGLLGEGGMGLVLAAKHVALGKSVVVKVLRARFGGRADMVERLRVEAQSLARLRSPHLVDVTDFGQTPDGTSYIVMERLYGRTVRDELGERGVLPISEAIDLVRQLLAGLAIAHDAGIIHRDIKLDNLFLCKDPPGSKPILKILDFGIAKIVNDGEVGGPTPPKYPTEEGQVLGTPRFLSPEQALGKRIDKRADLYAVGMALYILVAGRGPFHEIQGPLQLLRAHAREPPPLPSTLAPQQIPPALEAAIMRAIAKDPEDRFPNAGAFSRALEAVDAGAPALAPGVVPAEAPAPAQISLPPFSAAAAPQPRDAERRALAARGTVRMSEAPTAPVHYGTEALPQAFPVPPAPPAPPAPQYPTEALASPSPPAVDGARPAPDAASSDLTVPVPRPLAGMSSGARFILLVIAATIVFMALAELARRVLSR